MHQKLKQFFRERATPFSWRRIWLTVLIVGVLFGTAFVGLTAYAFTYADRVLPGVQVGNISLGGMERDELKRFLQEMSEKLTNDGLRFTFAHNGQTEQIFLYPVVVTDGSVIDLLRLDIDAEVEYLMNYGKDGDFLTRGMSALRSQLTQPQITLAHISADKDRIVEELAEEVSDYNEEARDASIVVTSLSPFAYDVVTSSPGFGFAYDQVVGQLVASWAQLRAPEISISQSVIEPTVTDADLDTIVERAPKVFDDGAIALTHKDPQTSLERNWTVSTRQLRNWVEVQPVEESFGFGLKKKDVSEYLEAAVADNVNRDARDAKFAIARDGKVTEFQGSRPGIALDVEQTYEALNSAFLGRTRHDEGVTKSVQIVVELVEPNVDTAEANDLGINEILGVGISNFSGSPANRIKNIRHAVNKLHGILVKPGEEFSTIEHTQPFTEEGGYLPELVIKGDEIKPEIGGGLCQIGTTLFRMAMNSAMPITQRRNHSLVVSYYNDLENGLPGTDATLYDPAPDFKFKNDTENHILVQTDMNVRTGFLTFTLWGTSDGRKGSYDKPVVKRWIEPGEKKIIQTTKLPPGVEECQNAYTGAEAAFTYTRELPDGTKEERVFESYYRPLPQICLVGVEELTQCQELPDGSTSCANQEENLFNPDGSVATPIVIE